MTTMTVDSHPMAGSLPGSAWLEQPTPGLIGWAERGWVPDLLLRLGIRRLLRQRLRDEHVSDPETEGARQRRLRAEFDAGPLAVATDAANAQHYEVPPAFFDLVLGPHRKYSSAYYRTGAEDLGTAEADMLALTCERAGLAEGQQVLELGCGWGSLSLWMARRYPSSRITAVSNSAAQREHILRLAGHEGLTNIEVITADLRTFSIDRRFDRIVSVECFEHLQNHRELFRRLAGWLADQGAVFIHVFTHRTASYRFTDDGDSDWMARHFFAGGIMPADTRFLYLQDHLRLEEHWQVSGRHYAQTAEHWLANLDGRRAQAESALRQSGLSPAAARLQAGRWRIFFLACAELWGYRGGSEWLVSHYRFSRR